MPYTVEELEEIPFTETNSHNRTGDWRFSIPVLEEDDCILCGQCVVYCPDDCIVELEEFVEVDYDYCKGCGICAEVCPTDAFEMEVD